MKIKAEISVIIDSEKLLNPEQFSTEPDLIKLATTFLYDDITSALEAGEFDDLVKWEFLADQ
jgi:hypothetical protein